MSNTKNLDIILKEVNDKYPSSKSQVALQGLFIDIAIAISRMRAGRGISQRDLARMLKTAQSTVVRWETPGYSSYTLTKLNELANALKYDLKLSFSERSGVETSTVRYAGWVTKNQTEHAPNLVTSRQAGPINDWRPLIVQSYSSKEGVRV